MLAAAGRGVAHVVEFFEGSYRVLSRQGPSGGLGALRAPPPPFPPARRPGPSCVRDGAGRAAG